MERKLDWTMTRKRMEIQEAFGKIIKVLRVPSSLPRRLYADPPALLPIQVRRKLRVFISHTVSGQSWQEPAAPPNGATGDEGLNFETGGGIPAWTLKIEGRLLDVRPKTQVCVIKAY